MTYGRALNKDTMSFMETCRSLIRALTLHDKEILKMNDECEFMLEFILRQLNLHLNDDLDSPRASHISAVEIGNSSAEEPQTDALPTKKLKRNPSLISNWA